MGGGERERWEKMHDGGKLSGTTLRERLIQQEVAESQFPLTENGRGVETKGTPQHGTGESEVSVTAR